MVGAVSQALISENSFMSSIITENEPMVLETPVDTDFAEAAITGNEDVPSPARLSDEEAEAVLDAYSAAVVAVADRVSPSVVNIAIEKDVTAHGPGASASTPYLAVDQASSSRRTATSSPTATSSTMRRTWK